MTTTPKLHPDETNRTAIQDMLRACFDWGVKNGYIVIDAQGVPHCAVPESVARSVAAETESSNVTTA